MTTSSSIPAQVRPLCRTCIHWKRRFHDLGTCWLPIQAGITVEEHDTCNAHTPKVLPPLTKADREPT